MKFRERLQRRPKTSEDKWRKLCGGRKKLDKKLDPRNLPVHRERDYKQSMNSGLRVIERLIEVQGEEVVQNMLENFEDVTLETQVLLLSLSETEEPRLIIDALNSIPAEQKESWRQRKRPRRVQWEVYRKILEYVLVQKEGDELFEAFERKVREKESIKEDSYQWILMLNFARQEGLGFMMEAIDYIPPKEITEKDFLNRLEIEREIVKTGEQLVERELMCSGEVQGVGFRGGCRMRARNWGIRNGFARNNRDGTVTVLLQSDYRRINGFCESFLNRQKALETKDFGMKVEEDKPLSEVEKIYEDFRALSWRSEY